MYNHTSGAYKKCDTGGVVELVLPNCFYSCSKVNSCVRTQLPCLKIDTFNGANSVVQHATFIHDPQHGHAVGTAAKRHAVQTVL